MMSGSKTLNFGVIMKLKKYDIKPFMEPQEALLGDGVKCYWVYFMDPEGMLFELQEKRLS